MLSCSCRAHVTRRICMLFISNALTILAMDRLSKRKKPSHTIVAVTHSLAWTYSSDILTLDSWCSSLEVFSSRIFGRPKMTEDSSGNPAEKPITSGAAKTKDQLETRKLEIELE